MKEVEMKVIDVPCDILEQKILGLGAQKIFDDLVVTQFYDYPTRLIEKAKDLVRLRKKGNTSYLTFKKYVEDATVKIRREYEIEVSDFTIADTILTSLGLEKTLVISKWRTSYKIDETMFEFDRHLDEYCFIPPFLEIESTDSTIIWHYVKKLDIPLESVKPWTFFDVKRYYEVKTKKSI
jgi:adenylate cyclase, class 2